MFAARIGIAFPLALIITITLFWVMQFLISIADRSLSDSAEVHFIDFVRVEKEDVVKRKEVKPKKPPKVEDPPEPPPTPQMDNVDPTAETIAISDVPVETSLNLDATGFGLTPSDGEYLPIVKVQPVYPRRALSRGVEGYVIVEFTVTKNGTTKDLFVVESKPSGMFDRAALKAASKFKYKPRVVDGQPIEVPGVQNKISFKLED